MIEKDLFQQLFYFQIEHHAAEKLVEHICLEYLMHFVARQLQFYSPEEAAEKLLDGKAYTFHLRRLIF